ncbi:tyrosinase family oxidase copper chaperone [Actinoplanes sp. NPDC023801]|uniref:tyrosinase family oxidase copper chaperone n=1 Tax=Actinoplanes sp. NPDC023801 TaxID=3154595 RepID=UPI0033CEA481
MISMQRNNQGKRINGTTRRAVAVVAVAVGALATAGTAWSATTAEPQPPVQAAASPSVQAVASAPAQAAPAQAASAQAAASAPAQAAPAVGKAKKLGFYETYRGHQIMGWGSGDKACAYIDGKRLVVYPADGGQYTSAVQGFKPERGLRSITKASVKALGDMDLAADSEPAAHCPQFEIKAPAAK